MSRSARTRLAVASVFAAVAGASLVSAGAPAGAAAPPDPTVLADGLLAPLSIATDGGAVYYNDGFQGKIYKVGTEAPIVDGGGKEIQGLSLDGADLIYTLGKKIIRRTPQGDTTVLASLFSYEKANNPDGDVKYGLGPVSKSCLSKWPDHFFPPKYTGIVESHPYGTAVDGSTVYVADAAANAILAINDGVVSTVAVLPVVRATLTKQMAKEWGVKLPDCVIGKTFKFEGVPTDVEVGPGGLLYVSSLPGGEVQGKGRILTIDPATGEVTKVLGGLSGATGVAVTPTGDIYATQLFGGTITVKPAGGSATTFAQAPLPAAVEVVGNALYASINTLPQDDTSPPAGQVVSYNLALP
ncbi:MAG TPA: ScyD/ScyE family protein [Nocardioides sp.]|nr:ScyD/ScyE family protein [Nocardioides sp.]